MRNLFKKSLACCLALALCLTAMVGVVSADEVTIPGTITVESKSVTAADDLIVDVNVTLAADNGDALKLSEVFLAVSVSEGAEITGVASQDGTIVTLTNGIVNFYPDALDGAADSANVTLKVALPNVAATYTVTAAIADAGAATIDEILVSADPASGSITVVEPKPEHVHVTGYTNNEDGTHTTICTAEDCDGSFVPATSDCSFVDGSCQFCGFVEPAKEPVKDATVIPTVAINISEKINARVVFSKEISNYADFELVVTRQKAYLNNSLYELSEAQEFVYSKEEAYSIVADGRAIYVYNELGMYELGIDFTIMARMYDADGNYVAYSEAVTTNIGKLAYALYSPTNASAKNKNIAIDIAKLGDEAQKYMVNGKDCGLATVTSPISYFPTGATEGATFDASKLNTVNVPNSAVSGITVTPTVNLSANPALRYLVNGTGTTYEHDTLALDIDYINGKNGSDCGVTLTKDDLSVVGTAGSSTVRYLNVFAGIALYDGNVPVTATLYSGETELASVTYSVESYIAANYGNTRMGAVLKAVANLGTSARAYFNMQ